MSSKPKKRPQRGHRSGQPPRRPARLPLDHPAAPTTRRPDRRRVLLAAGARTAGPCTPTAASTSTTRRREPAPFTTIAWRLAHVIVGVLAMRNHSHFDGPPADYQSWPYATDAATALDQLDEAYDDMDHRCARARRRRLDKPCGPAEGPYADYPLSDVGPAHQPRDDPPRRRDRLYPRPLRQHPDTDEKEN